MEKIKSYLLAGLITFIVIWFSVHSCQKQDIKQEARTVDSSSIFKQQLTTIQARGEAIKNKLHNDSLKTSLALQALKIENKNLRKKIKELRPDIVRIADTIPILDTFIGLTDSLLAVQQTEIDTLRSERIRNFKSFSAILSTKDEQQAIMKELIDHLEFINKDLAKDVRRERRRKTVFKILSGVIATVLLFEVIQD